MKVTNFLAGLAMSAVVLGGTPAANSADVPDQTFKVIGTWSNIAGWQKYEKPFWTEWLPEASNDRLKADAISISEAGLKGYEVIQLLKLGVFDFAHGMVGYVSEGNGLIEAADLAGMAEDFDTLRAIVEVYRPVMAETFEETFDAKILALYPWPPSMIFCNTPVAGPNDLRGKKIRIHSASLGDYVEGAGGTSVTMSFGEVLPSLQRGVVDCAITDAMSAYRAKWHEVIDYVVDNKLAYSLSFAAVNTAKWESLDPQTREIMERTFAKLEEEAWAGAKEDDANGVNCLTTGPCPVGEPGGAQRVVLDEEGLKAHDDILKGVVLKRWAERCPDCVDIWNATAGAAAGLAAPKM